MLRPMSCRRFSLSAASVGALVVVATLAPARAAQGIDPRAENFRIVGAYLAEDGKHVLFNAYEDAQAAKAGRPGLDPVGMVV